MYALSYYMPGKIEYYRVKKRRKVWVLPVFLCTFLLLGGVFVLLGYYAMRDSILQVAAEETVGVPQAPEPEEIPTSGGHKAPDTVPCGGDEIKEEPEQTAQSTASPCATQSPQPDIGPEADNRGGDSADTEKTKTMYLTFDDGPSAEYTDIILDVLAKYDIKATFFLVGENVEKRPEVAKRIAEEGHAIGIHCYSHAYDDIYDSVDSYVEDFEKAYQIIYETTGVEVKIFRFPGGSVNGYNKHVCKDIITEMTERGYVYFDWNASLEDAVKKTTPEELVKNAKDTAMNRDRVILLAHDTIHNTSLCIEDIILQFPEYTMETLTEEVVPIRFRLN